MDVQMIEKRSVPLASGATQTFPAGWIGSVADELAAQWIAEGAAVGVAGVSSQGFTPAQHAVLAAAADQALLLAAQEQVAEEQQGEGGEGGEKEPEISLDDLRKDELLELAVQAGIEGAGEMRKDELLDALKALQQPAADEHPASE